MEVRKGTVGGHNSARLPSPGAKNYGVPQTYLCGSKPIETRDFAKLLHLLKYSAHVHFVHGPLVPCSCQASAGPKKHNIKEKGSHAVQHNNIHTTTTIISSYSSSSIHTRTTPLLHLPQQYTYGIRSCSRSSETPHTWSRVLAMRGHSCPSTERQNALHVARLSTFASYFLLMYVHSQVTVTRGQSDTRFN